MKVRTETIIKDHYDRWSVVSGIITPVFSKAIAVTRGDLGHNNMVDVHFIESNQTELMEWVWHVVAWPNDEVPEEAMYVGTLDQIMPGDWTMHIFATTL